MLAVISRAVRRRQGHDHRCHASPRGRVRSGDYRYVITVTTRQPREGEVDGVDYHFVSREDFLRLRAARGFLEANEVHGNWYGSPRQPVRDALASGRDAILKIDVQGAGVVGAGDQALLIFVIPPSLETLFARLRARNRDRRRARAASSQRRDRAGA